MRILYWLVKLVWYFVITVIATTYWKGFGWWIFMFGCRGIRNH